MSVLLYASMAADARDDRVDIRQPVTWSDKGPASVILRPVPLLYLAELLASDRCAASANKRRELADRLVIPRIRKPDLRAELMMPPRQAPEAYPELRVCAFLRPFGGRST